MKFNTKIRYGLRTMIELAVTGSDNGILQKNIAKNQEISEKYLDHIIASLKVSGLIKNVKGKKSGYKLAKEPHEIPVIDIFSAFEQNISGPDCVHNKDVCKRSEKCSARIFWGNLNSTMVDYLKSVTLKDIATLQKDLIDTVNPEKMYHI